MSKNLIEMVESQLIADGYDALLYLDIRCGCRIGNLAPCGQISLHCQQAYINKHSVSGKDVMSLRRNLTDAEIDDIIKETE